VADENILDLVIGEAHFDPLEFEQLPELLNHYKSNVEFLTAVTVDFYNHETETTQSGDGLRPDYHT